MSFFHWITHSFGRRRRERERDQTKQRNVTDLPKSNSLRLVPLLLAISPPFLVQVMMSFSSHVTSHLTVTSVPTITVWMRGTFDTSGETAAGNKGLTSML